MPHNGMKDVTLAKLKSRFCNQNGAEFYLTEALFVENQLFARDVTLLMARQ